MLVFRIDCCFLLQDERTCELKSRIKDTRNVITEDMSVALPIARAADFEGTNLARYAFRDIADMLTPNLCQRLPKHGINYDDTY